MAPIVGLQIVDTAGQNLGLRKEKWVLWSDTFHDKLTRGTTADSLINDDIWWNGPEYLSQSGEIWPTMPLLATSSDDEEGKRKYRFTFLTFTKTEMSMPELKCKDTRETRSRAIF